MSDDRSSPIKSVADSIRAARGLKGGPPVDPLKETQYDFPPVTPDATLVTSAAETFPKRGEQTLVAPPMSGPMEPAAEHLAPAPAQPGNTDPTFAATPTEASPTSAPEGITLIAPPFEATLGSAPADATLRSGPSDATLGSLDADTADFHRKALESAPKAVTKGASFGNYELLEPIAKGGMGIVYKARQRNLNRIVALKMILAGQFADQSDIDRFYAEAEAAAALSHPNIVAIHEIGEVSGQHFFSMDYIEGKSLSGLIQENPVSPRRAAELMITIAETMQFAHDSGVVHRDLKPANVLLDKRQRPLVTDFGLAKQVSNQSQMTMAGSILGTPSYMPPEQAAGRLDQVGTWSDLYSLGAILYELLTGRPPFRAASPFETIRQVLEMEPPSPRLLNPNVPKDLETICLKCLQKERTRRYGSAQELADELNRFLRGEPIHARPISNVARFWRLCKRYPITSSIAAAAVLSVVAALAVVTISYIRTSAALRRESAALALSEASFADQSDVIDEMLTTVGEKRLAKLPGGQPIQKELLDKALVFNARFLKQRGNDPRVANEVARSHYRVGKISMTLGRYDDALKPLATAKEMQERLLTKDPSDGKKLKALGDSLTELGQISIVAHKDYETAGKYYTDAASIRDRLAAATSDKSDLKVENERLRANAHMNAGVVAFNVAQINPDDKAFEAKMADARRQFQEAQAIRLSLLVREKKNLNVRRDLGKGYFNLGDLERVDGNVQAAIGHFRSAADVFQALLEDDPKDIENQSNLAVSRRLVATLLVSDGQSAEAREWYERALARLETLTRENPDVPGYQSEQGGLLLNLFELEKAEGNDKVARSALLRARRIYESLNTNFPGVAAYRWGLAMGLRQLGEMEAAGGNIDAGKDDVDKARQLFVSLVEQFPNEADYATELQITERVVAAIEVFYGTAAFSLRFSDAIPPALNEEQLAKARAHFQSSLHVHEELLADSGDDAALQRDLAKDYYNLGCAQSDDSAAADYFRRAVDTFKKVLDQDGENLGLRTLLSDARRLGADALRRSGNAQAAREAYVEELAHLDGLLPEATEPQNIEDRQALVLRSIGKLELAEIHFEAARKAIEKAVAIHTSLATKIPGVPYFRYGLALTLRQKMELEQAAGNDDAAAADRSKSLELLTRLCDESPDNAEYAYELRRTQATPSADTVQ
jgi:eukaryotic-like serine/threonine-protein kinase